MEYNDNIYKQSELWGKAMVIRLVIDLGELVKMALKKNLGRKGGGQEG
jgi:hypothetical protein